ncbi:MAG: hypothetical protein AAFX00_08650 [Pseudomonadota bacterium]
MEGFFASTVLEGESEAQVDSRLFAGAMADMGHFLATLLGALSQHDNKLVMLHRAALLSDFEEDDFDAPVDLTGLNPEKMTPGRLVAGEPYSGQLDAPLPSTGAYIAILEEDAGDAAVMSLVAVKAENAGEALKHILTDVRAGDRQLLSLTSLMDAALHPDENYEFEAKPSQLAAEIAGGAPIAKSETVALG